jgi:hypothetical protein
MLDCLTRLYQGAVCSGLYARRYRFWLAGSLEAGCYIPKANLCCVEDPIVGLCSGSIKDFIPGA